jgi:hypothetical protein
MKKNLLLLLLLFGPFVAFSQNLRSPDQFLGYELGTKFTRHHRIVEYFNYVADSRPNVKIEQYGETNEGRPLIVAILSNQENFNNLEQIRQDNLKRTGLVSGSPEGSKISIVWLSYNVHGNESSSSEATMKTLYDLANPQNPTTQAWLKNTVVIIDPCINPDGRDRYANFYNQYGNATPNPNLDSKEHNEPWPGGRANHYLFDLNRDWAWQSQVESRGRIKLYNQWMPHVHVDFHEQGLNNPYYFAPAVEPYHEVITGWQRQFQDMLGRNHARYFDKNGWLYFTKEVFDLLYPSYGDTYPTYNGAIGMTYEKGGSGRAGLAARMENDDTVKLADRVEHHYTTGISTVETTSNNAEKVVDEFTKYFDNSRNNPAGQYKSFVVKATNNADKLTALKDWLDLMGLSHGVAGTRRTAKGFNYHTKRDENFSLEAADLVISMYQPRSNMVKVLFEPDTRLSDSVTYDITAWSIPYVYDLDAFAVAERINPASAPQSPAFTPISGEDKPYAYIGKYQSFKDLQWAAHIMKKGVKVRMADSPFALNGVSYERGTLVVLRWDNEHNKSFDAIIQESSSRFKKEIIKAATGYVDTGRDFGSSHVGFVKTPNVAVVAGQQVSSLSFGEIWYYFEQQLEYPVTILDTDYLKNVDLANYDVLIVPNGFYRLFDDSYLGKLRDWVRGGGRLILIERALNSFVDKEGFSLSKYVKDEDKKKAEEADKKDEENRILARYEDQEREGISYSNPGSIFKIEVDNTHPLAFGYSSRYYALKGTESRFAFLKEGWNVGVIKNSAESRMAGFVGAKVLPDLENTLSFGVEGMGRGQVVYFVDNPLFRAFWYNAKMLFGNAIFFAGQ